MTTLTFGSLFAGIGGMDLGLERAGMQCKWQVEIDPYAQKVLAKHWPNVARHSDVREVGSRNLAAVDVIAGGFPCQDVSYAGPGAGLNGARSGLWYEFARIIRELGPRFVLVENVAALLDRGMGEVLGSLSDLGFDAEWSVVSACSVGAPHVRRRVFIVAYANGLDGRSGIRHPAPQEDGTLQALHRFASARARYRERMADPSALYRDADGLPFGMERNHGIGNAVHVDVAEFIGRRLVAHAEAAQ